MSFSWKEVKGYYTLALFHLIYDNKYMGSIYKSERFPNKYLFNISGTLLYFDTIEECKEALLNHTKSYLGIPDCIEIGREGGLVMYEF